MSEQMDLIKRFRERDIPSFGIEITDDGPRILWGEGTELCMSYQLLDAWINPEFGSRDGNTLYFRGERLEIVCDDPEREEVYLRRGTND